MSSRGNSRYLAFRYGDILSGRRRRNEHPQDQCRDQRGASGSRPAGSLDGHDQGNDRGGFPRGIAGRSPARRDRGPVHPARHGPGGARRNVRGVASLRPRYLIDKSALARMPLDPVRRRLAPILEAGEAATCAIIDLEVLYSARGQRDYDEIRRRRALAYESAPITEEILERAISIQAELAKTGRHRIPIPDLIIAATAESAGLTLLHYDHDY